MFGLPRIITCEKNLDALFAAVPDRHNGLTFCTGSLGAGRENDLPHMAEKYADRIFFAHLRQLSFSGEKDFAENGHMTSQGNLDICGVVRALVKKDLTDTSVPITGGISGARKENPGYGLYDRALGAAYLNGLFEATEREVKK